MYTLLLVISSNCRYDNELECIVDLEGDNQVPSSTREKLLLQQIKMLREQRQQLQV